jgi:hypothetical protein
VILARHQHRLDPHAGVFLLELRDGGLPHRFVLRLGEIGGLPLEHDRLLRARAEGEQAMTAAASGVSLRIVFLL